VKVDVLKDYRVIPLEEDEKRLKLLAPEGYDPFLLEELRFLLGKEIDVVLVDQNTFAQELQRRLAQEEVVVEGEEGEAEALKDLLLEEDKSPAVSFVNSMLIKATTLSASDIHIEPYQDASYVRFRLDGILHDYMNIPLSLHESVVSRIKILANMNVAEKRVPQDGKIRVKVGGREMDIRVSSVPTVFGERVVLRLLDRSNQMLTLEDLGLSAEDLAKGPKARQKTLRHSFGYGSHWFWKEHHPLRHDPAGKKPREKHHHHRGPARVSGEGR
jgi:general secretion pathway protein E